MKQSTRELPHGKGTVTPYIAVKGAADFIDFLKRAFDAKEFGRAENPDGTIGHAEVQIGNSTLMLFDSKREWQDTPSFLSIYVEDADDVFAQALKAGATQVTERTNFSMLGDRAGRVHDAFGNIWWIQTHFRDVTQEETARLLQDPEELTVMQKFQETFVKEMDKRLQPVMHFGKTLQFWSKLAESRCESLQNLQKTRHFARKQRKKSAEIVVHNRL